MEGVIRFVSLRICFPMISGHRLLLEFSVFTRLRGLWNKAKSYRHKFKNATFYFPIDIYWLDFVYL